MKNYVYIFHVDSHMDDAAEAKVGEWFASLGDKVVDSGKPFNPEAQAQVSEGKVTMDADTTAGYTVVKAENLEEAVTMAMSCPIAMAPGCSISVYETMAM